MAGPLGLSGDAAARRTAGMKVAKLSDGRVVQLLKQAQPVRFASGLHVLVADRLTAVPSRIIPYWVPATFVVRVIDFT